MKNSVHNVILFLLANCLLFLAFVACSESSTAGATVDDNSVAAHQVDSVKVFWDKSYAMNDSAEIDSTIYWYEIEFQGTGEEYFVYEVEKPYTYCSVRIYHSEYGTWMVERLPNGNHLLRTVFLTSDNDEIVYHKKLDDYYSDEKYCEKDLADFEKSCEDNGWMLYRHMSDCSKKELHLTCSSSKERLMRGIDEVLEEFAEKMKEQCMESI